MTLGLSCAFQIPPAIAAKVMGDEAMDLSEATVAAGYSKDGAIGSKGGLIGRCVDRPRHAPRLHDPGHPHGPHGTRAAREPRPARRVAAQHGRRQFAPRLPPPVCVLYQFTAAELHSSPRPSRAPRGAASACATTGWSSPRTATGPSRRSLRGAPRRRAALFRDRTPCPAARRPPAAARPPLSWRQLDVHVLATLRQGHRNHRISTNIRRRYNSI